MKLGFISDLHLSEKTPSTNEGFFKFLKTAAQEFSHLYILGDLFESWVGDDDDSSFAKDESSSSPTQDSNKSPKMYRCENSCAAVFKNLKKPSFVEGVFSDKWRSDMNPSFIHSL